LGSVTDHKFLYLPDYYIYYLTIALIINIWDYLIFTNADIHKEINTMQQLLEKMANVTYLKKMGTSRMSKQYENIPKTVNH